MSDHVDLDKLEAVLADPLIDWKAGFGHGLFSDGWSYDAAVIIAEALNAVPGLIAECKRLREQQLVCGQALLRIREHADITALIAKRASDLRKAAR